MRSTMNVVLALVLGLAVTSAQAGLYEGFSPDDYTLGQSIDDGDGGTGWDGQKWFIGTSSGGVDAVAVTVDPGLGGGYGLFTDSNTVDVHRSDPERAFPTPYTHTGDSEFWFSFMVAASQWDDANPAELSTRLKLEATGLDADGDANSIDMQFGIDSSVDLGIRNNNTKKTVSLDDSGFDTPDDGSATWFIGKVVMNETASDTVRYWINPSDDLSTYDYDSGDLTFVMDTDGDGGTAESADVSEFSSVRIFHSNDASNAIWDELRFGTTLGEVVPEPTTMALVGLGGLAGLIRRRR